MSNRAQDPLTDIPAPGERRLALRVTRAAQRAVRSGHPWLWQDAITHQSGEGRPGDLAVVFDDARRFLAVGLYDPTSPLRVRVLHAGSPLTIDKRWLLQKLQDAAGRRAALPETGTTGYRLVHGENDGLPGLVIDRYADTLVLKLYTLAWIPHLADLRAALGDGALWRADERAEAAETGAPDGQARLVLRLSRELQRRPEHLFGLADGALLAGDWDAEDGERHRLTGAGPLPAGTVLFRENRLRFEADIIHGQKTGFFLDQRDNRARVGKVAAGKRALNVFAYSGGFSLYAARGGAVEVTDVDASAPALAAAGRNFALNRDVPAVTAARHALLNEDAFAALAALRQHGQQFDLVIVDPPSFARQASEVKAAIEAYARLTTLAVSVLARGGVLVMASCSSRVSAPAFFATVNSAAARAGRPLRELERTGHAIDHPVAFPEGAYLKCLFATA